MKKSENVDLFLEIIHQKLSNQASELKGGFLYLSTESISVVELAEIIGKSASEIIAFFDKKGKRLAKISDFLESHYLIIVKV